MVRYRSSIRSAPRIVAAVAVALLVVIAGCSGLNSAPWGGNDAGTGTPSPAPDVLEQTTSDERASTEASPPGVSEGEISNVSALARANRQALFETGYVSGFELQSTVTQQGQSRNLTMAQREVVEPNADQFLFQTQRQVSSQSVRFDVWSNGSTTLMRQDQAGQVSFQRSNATRVRPQLGGRQMLEAYLQTGEFSLESVDQSREPAVLTFTSEQYLKPPGSELPARENVSRYDARVEIDERGRVHKLRLRMSYSGPQGGQATLEVSYELLRTESVPVDQPPWIEQALENTTSPGDESGGY